MWNSALGWSTNNICAWRWLFLCACRTAISAFSVYQIRSPVMLLTITDVAL